MAISTGSITIDFPDLEVNFPKEGGTISTDVFINNATSWSLKCPLSWSLINETVSSGNRILKVAFTAPSNSANAVANIPTKFTAWNSRETVSEDLPVTIARNLNSSYSYVALPLFSGSMDYKATGSTQTQVAVLYQSPYPVSSSGLWVSNLQWINSMSRSIESESAGSPGNYVAYYTFTFDRNRTGVDKTGSIDFYINGTGGTRVAQGNYKFYVPTDNILFTNKPNPYVISMYNGRVPGLNLDLPIMYSTDFQNGILLLMVSSGSPDFHISTSFTTMSIGNGYVTRSYNTRWAQNFTPFPRTGSINFTLNSGSIFSDLTWEVRQAPFISYPYPTPDSDTVTVGPDATSLILGVTYYMGSSGSSILSPVVMNTGWAWSIVGQNEVETGDVLTRRFFYTASFGANNTSQPRNQEVSFRIVSGSRIASRSVSVTQNSQTSTEGYVTVVPATQSIGSEGGTTAFTVTYVGNRNIWSVDLPTTDLLYSRTLLGQDSSAVSYSYNFEVPRAVSPRGQTHQITFNMSSTNDTQTAVGTIKQSGTTGPSISFVTPSPYNISREGGDVPIEVRYLDSYAPESTSVRVSSGASRFMIQEEATSFEGSGNEFTGRYVVTVAANPSQNSITGSLVFSVDHNNTTEASRTFYIYQSATESGSSNPPTITVLNTPIYANYNQTLVYPRVRYYLPDEANTTILAPTWNYISSGSATFLGSNIESDTGTVRTVVYTASIGTNTSLQDTRILQPKFAVISGSYQDSAVGSIYQTVQTSSTEVQITLSSPSITIDADTEIIDNAVTVNYLGIGDNNIPAPTKTGNVYSVPATSTTQDGDDIHETYRIILSGPNTSSNPVTSSVTFRAEGNGGQMVTKTFYIYQRGASGGGGNIEILPYPSGTLYRSWDYTVQNIEVRYNGVTSTNFIANPTYTGRITNINCYSLNSLGSYCVGKYNVYMAANSRSVASQNDVTFKVISGSQQKTETVHIIQNPSGSDGSTWIECPRSVIMPAEGGWRLPACTVIYHGVSGSSQIGYPMTYRPGKIFSIWTASQSYGSLSSSRTYTVDMYPNSESTAWTSSVTWSILQNDATLVEAVTEFYQPTMSAGIPGITVTPQNLNVPAATTSSTFYVTYSNFIGYTINTPEVSGMQVTAVGSQDSGSSRLTTYRATYPANSTNVAKLMSAIFSMTSGSNSITQQVFITQAAGSQNQGIFVENSSLLIPYDQTRTLVRVDYYGISSVDAATTPSSTDNNWTATVAGFQEEDGHVSVIWEIIGPVNNSENIKQVVFTFNAVGLPNTATLIISQDTAGSGTLAGSGIIPAWKDTNTIVGNGDSWEVVCKSSNGIVLFDERMYRAPDLSYLAINFNRLAESFLEPREFPEQTGATPVFSFTTDLVEGGSKYTYEYKVVDDWSYDEDVDIESEYILSKPYQDEVAIGQYLVYSVLRTPGTTANSINLLKNGNLVAATTPPNYQYQDFSYKIDDCGIWSIKSGMAGNILQSWTTVDAKYVLYYYNKYAGWDSFVIKGPVIPSVDVTRNTYLNYRRNSRSYQNGVVGKFRVNTGILSDEISPVVTEFAASPRLVLHELDRDILIPVKVSTTSIERKTFRNQGRQFAKYEFDLEADLAQIRR